MWGLVPAPAPPFARRAIDSSCRARREASRADVAASACFESFACESPHGRSMCTGVSINRSMLTSLTRNARQAHSKLAVELATHLPSRESPLQLDQVNKPLLHDVQSAAEVPKNLALGAVAGWCHSHLDQELCARLGRLPRGRSGVKFSGRLFSRRRRHMNAVPTPLQQVADRHGHLRLLDHSPPHGVVGRCALVRKLEAPLNELLQILPRGLDGGGQLQLTRVAVCDCPGDARTQPLHLGLLRVHRSLLCLVHICQRGVTCQHVRNVGKLAGGALGHAHQVCMVRCQRVCGGGCQRDDARRPTTNGRCENNAGSRLRTRANPS